MKNRIYALLAITSLTFLFMTWAMPLYSQIWLKEGQIWQYEVYGGWNPNNYGIHSMVVQGDTILHGIACKIVTHYPLDSPPKVNYVYENDEQVFIYNSFEEVFEIFYDFNLNIGDTLRLPWNAMYILLDAGVINLGNVNRKFQYIHLIGNTLVDTNYLVLEGIGLVGSLMQTDSLFCSYFFPFDGFCNSAVDGWNIYFRCFQDGVFSYRPFDECTLSGTSPLLENQVHFAISPNPAHQSFLVKLNGQFGLGSLELLSTTGQIVHRQAAVDLDNLLEVPVVDLPNGLYFVRLTNEHGSVSKTVVVNH